MLGCGWKAVNFGNPREDDRPSALATKGYRTSVGLVSSVLVLSSTLGSVASAADILSGSWGGIMGRVGDV